MRIAVITNVYPPRIAGGAGRIASVYSELLRAHGHEVRVWEAEAAFSGLAMRSALSRVFFHMNDLSADRGRVEEIIAWKPDILITHNLTGCGFGTPRAVRHLGVRWVHMLHDVQLIEPSGQILEGESLPWARGVWRRLWSALRHWALSEPDVVVSPTAWLLDFHRGFGWFATCRTELIPNPVAVVAAPGRARNEFTRVVYAGRLDLDKGIDLLLAAWKQLAPSRARLIFIGEGSQRQKIEALRDSSIEVRGPLPHDQVQNIFATSDLVVVPSRVWENQPTVILEALAADCRVVASDVGGVRETLRGAGWIVRPNSVEDLMCGIRSALESVDTSERERERMQIVKSHAPESCVVLLERCFSDVSK